MACQQHDAAGWTGNEARYSSPYNHQENTSQISLAAVYHIVICAHYSLLQQHRVRYMQQCSVIASDNVTVMSR